MLKLKLQYFGHEIWRANSLGKDPAPGKDWAQEEKEVTKDEVVGWHRQLNGHKFEHTQGDSEGQVAHRVAKSQTWLSDWTTTKC